MSLFFLPQGLSLLSEGLLLLVSASFCMGLTGCSSGPTFYDETNPLTPPPFSPPPLKAIEAPLSSDQSTQATDSEMLAEDTEPDNSGLAQEAPPSKGPLSSPLSTLSADSRAPKKPAPSNVIRMSEFVKKS